MQQLGHKGAGHIPEAPQSRGGESGGQDKHQGEEDGGQDAHKQLGQIDLQPAVIPRGDDLDCAVVELAPHKEGDEDSHQQRGVAGEEGQHLAGGAELIVACGNALHGHIHARVVQGGLLLGELGLHGVPGQLVGEVQQVDSADSQEDVDDQQDPEILCLSQFK